MDRFIEALFVLGATTATLAALALLPQTGRTARLANVIGPWGAALGCLYGLAALLLEGGWSTLAQFSLPWGLPVGAFHLGLDALSRIFLLPVFVLGLVCALSGRAALWHAKPQEHNLAAHWFFYLVLVLGMALVISARDAALFLMSWEAMSLAPFFLIDFNDNDRSVRDASWVYLVAAHLGGVFLLAFFVLLSSGGGTSFTSFTSSATSSASFVSGGALNSTVLFVLAVLGFGAKAGLAPLHVWLPEAHPAAPSHVSALLSGAMLNAGLYGLLRAFDFFGPLAQMPDWWSWALLFAGFASALTGILKALAQSDMKRMLAYSSVENMGIMIMGTGAALMGVQNGSPWMGGLAYAGVLFHMLNHSAFKGLLFLCAGEVLHGTGTVNMAQLGGLQKRMPTVSAAFALGAAAIACLPPFNGFVGEFVLGMGLVKGVSLPGVELRLALLGALTGLALISGLSAVVFAKAYGISFLGEARSGFAAQAVPPEFRNLLPLALPAAVCALAGFCGPWIFEITLAGAQQASAFTGGMISDVHREIAASILPSLKLISIVGLTGVGLVGSLLLLRRALLRAHGVRQSATWGCGYQYGSPRIQYTPASFSEPVANLFGPAMGVKVQRQRDAGLFLGRTQLVVSAPDRLRSGLFTPLFEGVEQACNFLKIVQHGRIHLYILYILVTLVALLIWGVQS